MTTLALIAAACIWFAAGYLAAEIVRVARRISTLDRAESTLADGDELLCINATVFRERTGEIAWIDNEKPMGRMQTVMKKKLEVTPAEMLELRAQGMSNHDIAKSLDISMSAVYKYIGSQGGVMERMAAFADDKPVKPKTEPTPAYQPDVISATYRISDEIVAEIEHNPTRITLERGDGAITITADEAATLTQFLVWAANSARKE